MAYSQNVMQRLKGTNYPFAQIQNKLISIKAQLSLFEIDNEGKNPYFFR